MKDLPILFSGTLVREILADRKSKTRRLVDASRAKCAADCSGPQLERAWVDPGGTPLFGPGPYLKVPCAEGAAQRVYPRYEVGDRLWVQEAHTLWAAKGQCYVGITYHADETQRTVEVDYPTYKALRTQITFRRGRGRPGRFMPRWASRITLDVTSIGVERLQAITAEDAVAEGVVDPSHGWNGNPYYPRYRFRFLWDELHAEKGSWDSNPWVWVVGFKRIEQAARGAA